VDELASKLDIREVIERWVVWRDAGDWDRFAEVWHSDGYMTATWFQGGFADFIAVSRQGVTLKEATLGSFPYGYRHLGYLQTELGFTVKTGLPGLDGEAAGRLYAEGRAWLDGSATPGVPL
jgi:hypothetical protein